MTYSDQSYNLRIELDTKGCELSAAEIEDMEEDLHTLRNLVEDFPVSDLHVTVVHHGRSDDYHIKTTLTLSGRTLFTGERHAKIHPAFESCIRKLAKKVRAYKHQMRIGSETAKQTVGTKHNIEATGQTDLQALIKAVASDDYPAFRREVDVFEGSLSERVGRWVERYPQIQSQLGDTITVSDLVEEVFLNAFDRFETRSQNVPPGQWFESLIDPSVQALIQSPDEEFARISFARDSLET